MAQAAICHALVVDDDPLILMDVCAILEDAGFVCAEAGTGADAIAFLEAHHRAVTLLFSDVEMPGDINGFSLARHVDQHWPHIEIVIASGRVKPETGELPDRASFIGKPFSARMVHEHLRGAMPEEKQPEPLKRAG